MIFLINPTKKISEFWNNYFKSQKVKDNLADPFLNTSNCVTRLLDEYKKHPRLIIALDYDSTVCPWPKGKNHTHEKVLGLVREAQKIGFYIVVFTASAPERFGEMKDFLADKGIRTDAINQNPINLPFGNNGKIYYNLLIDDRAGAGQACEILEQVIEKVLKE